MKYASITLMCCLSVIVSIETIQPVFRVASLILIFVIGVVLGTICSRNDKLIEDMTSSIVIKTAEQDLIIAEYRKKYPLDYESEMIIKKEIQKMSNIIENGGKETIDENRD